MKDLITSLQSSQEQLDQGPLKQADHHTHDRLPKSTPTPDEVTGGYVHVYPQLMEPGMIPHDVQMEVPTAPLQPSQGNVETSQTPVLAPVHSPTYSDAVPPSYHPSAPVPPHAPPTTATTTTTTPSHTSLG